MLHLNLKKVSKWRHAGLACVGLALAAMVSPAAAEAYKMKVGFLTINDPIHAVGKRFAEEVSKRSGGRIEAEVYPAGQLGSAARQIEGMQFGTQEAFVTPPGYLAGLNAGFQVLDAPGIFTSVEQAHAVVTNPDFQKVYLNLAQPAGVEVGNLWVYGPTSIASVKPIAGLEDLEGLKVRVLATKLEQELASKLGMVGVSIDFTEALSALQTGTVDAARTSLVVMTGMKFYETTKHVFKDGTGTIFGVVTVSSAWLETLPEDLRTMVMEVARDIQDEGTAIGIELAEKADKVWTDAGATIVELDDDERTKLFESVAPIGEKYLAGNEKTEPVWRALQAAIKAEQGQ
ncbi:MAG: TRAP transporter substrate-binding protein [Alphaproteobacteria bacterium]|nr:TRAP transporter substrate-binding protein [Alphaproteobacteria bacterium]MBO6862006.1 TRAP transporter substrate-binding protein [Alphaproteobacteria bacterium]